MRGHVLTLAIAVAVAGSLWGCGQQSHVYSGDDSTRIVEQEAPKDEAGASGQEKQADNLQPAKAQATVLNKKTKAKAVLRPEEQRSATSASNNKKRPKKRVCYLTFDDGPSPNTERILKILDGYGIKATWFVQGQVSYMSKIKKLWRDGMQVAVHTYCHSYEKIYASSKAFWDDYDKTARIIEKKLGFWPTIFRFPGGSINDFNRSTRSKIFKQAAKKGYHYFDWNVSSGDAVSVTPTPAKKIVSNVKKYSAQASSCCVLMHDTSVKDTTVEALPRIIKYYISQGYTFDVLCADSFGYQF